MTPSLEKQLKFLGFPTLNALEAALGSPAMLACLCALQARSLSTTLIAQERTFGDDKFSRWVENGTAFISNYCKIFDLAHSEPFGDGITRAVYDAIGTEVGLAEHRIRLATENRNMRAAGMQVQRCSEVE